MVSLNALISLFAADSSVADCLARAESGDTPAFDITLVSAARPLLLGALAEKMPSPILVVTSTFRQAETLAEQVGEVLGEEQVAYYPAWETLPHERLSPRSDTVGRRLEVLRRLKGTGEMATPKIVVAPVRALMQPQVKGIDQLRPIRLISGADYDLSEVVAQLVQVAYVRTDMVERRGEFSLRGGILDIFPPTAEHPVRVDFFGDTIEEIRPFGIADQLSFGETLPEISASPCRELLLTDEVRARAGQLASNYLDDTAELGGEFAKIAQGLAPEGMEALAPALVGEMELIVDVLPSDSTIVIVDPELTRSRAKELHTTSQEFLHASWVGAASGGRVPIDFESSAYWSLAAVRAHVLNSGQRWWSISPFENEILEAEAAGSAVKGKKADNGNSANTDKEEITHSSSVETTVIKALELPNWRGDTEAAVASIEEGLAASHHVALLAETKGLAKRLAEILADSGIVAPISDDNSSIPPAGQAWILVSGLSHGFMLPSVGLDVYSLGDLTGSKGSERTARKMPARRKKQIDPVDLKLGDALVHEHHGVGRYKEMVTRTVQGITREYLVVEFAPGKRGHPRDQLFVPVDQLHLLTPYVGGEQPTLDKLGGADWAKRKSKAKRAVREIAQELIRLYAARQASEGHAFGPDTAWQGELEDSFAFIETPDQLSAVSDVKADMERTIPMDRLICGDVGYGKTEIAVRAAFKAVMDNKQVAILVPTTLLVQQHLTTFSQRCAGFPLRVAALSRFQTEKERKRVIADMESGAVDIVIGTHRLLSSEVKFKDLGLVIIDEEQRFGVEHKEALKKLRLNVDVLAMSATPIPRTLEMAVTGIREMSVIATPPEERHPVLTFAGPYDATQIRAAIRRELAREGQAFFIHNRVSSIEKAAQHLAELVPEARIAVAHGQMNEKQLEQVMIDFWQRRFDVLVCTTIIESGLDVTNANTLIIERADVLGLSQLHQLRGRVGRGRERGYAYFLYPEERMISETAHDRLATMAAHTDLGSGIAIAMRDLEIRGAGNLLGGEQSGHIAEVGFDMYIRLVGEAVADYRGEDTEPEVEMRIELPVDAHLPNDYVESERLRLELYKRIAGAHTSDDLEAIAAELADRFGALPAETKALLAVAGFRLKAKTLGITEVTTQGNYIKLAPLELPVSVELRILRLFPGTQVRKAQTSVLVPRPTVKQIGGEPITGEPLLSWAHSVLTAIGSR